MIVKICHNTYQALYIYTKSVTPCIPATHLLDDTKHLLLKERSGKSL